MDTGGSLSPPGNYKVTTCLVVPGLKPVFFFIRAMTDGCGGVFHGSSGNITSPKSLGSSKYPASTECIWQIEAEDGYHLAFDFNGRFEVEDSPGCNNDYLLVEDDHAAATPNSSVRARSVIQRHKGTTCGLLSIHPLFLLYIVGSVGELYQVQSTQPPTLPKSPSGLTVKSTAMASM